MIDDRTPHLNLPLPHQDNFLSDDVLRLRAAISAIDNKTAFLDGVLQSDDVTLDTVQEIVNAVKDNRADLDGFAALAADANDAKLAAEAARDTTIEVASNYIPSATQPADPPAGEYPLWWDGSIMRVWDGTEWQDASSAVSGLRQVFHYSLAAGQTVVSGADANGDVLVFDRATYLDVFLNGSRIVLGDDFTADAVAQSITLSQPASADGLDVLDVVSYTNLTMVDADFDTVFAQKDALGTASAANLTTSATDTTAGRVLKVGDFGVGNVGASVLIDEFAKHWPEGGYRCTGSANGSLNAPFSNTAVGAVRVFRPNATTTTFLVVSGSSAWFAVYDGSVLSAWRELLHAGNLALTDTQHGSRAGGGLHATATTSTAGFLSAADKSKLDGIQSGAQVNAVTSVAGKTGAVSLTGADVGLGNVPNVDATNASNLSSGIVPNARLNAGTTTAPGIVQLNNTLTSTSTSQALTAAQGKALSDALAGKQAALVSGTNIKTINGQSLLGSGSIEINSGGPQPVVDHGDVATSSSQTVNCDVSASDFHIMSMATANTTGTLTINFTNIPDLTGKRHTWHVRLRRGGIKTVSFSPAVTWAGGVAPTFGNYSFSYDLIMFYKVGSEGIRGMVVDAW